MVGEQRELKILLAEITISSKENRQYILVACSHHEVKENRIVCTQASAQYFSLPLPPALNTLVHPHNALRQSLRRLAILPHLRPHHDLALRTIMTRGDGFGGDNSVDMVRAGWNVAHGEAVSVFFMRSLVAASEEVLELAEETRRTVLLLLFQLRRCKSGLFNETKLLRRRRGDHAIRR